MRSLHTSSVMRAPNLDTKSILARQRIGPFSLASAGVFVATGVGLYFYYQHERREAARQREQKQNQGIGSAVEQG